MCFILLVIAGIFLRSAEIDRHNGHLARRALCDLPFGCSNHEVRRALRARQDVGLIDIEPGPCSGLAKAVCAWAPRLANFLKGSAMRSTSGRRERSHEMHGILVPMIGWLL
jgi:hypothetical protein